MTGGPGKIKIDADVYLALQEGKIRVDDAAVFAVAFGLYTHVSPVLPITGAQDLVKLLTEDVENLTGGKLVLEADPLKAVEGIEEHIIKKRRAFGLSID